MEWDGQGHVINADGSLRHSDIPTHTVAVPMAHELRHGDGGCDASRCLFMNLSKEIAEIGDF